METGGSPGPDPPEPAVVLHETGRTRVSRVFVRGRPVVRKVRTAPGAGTAVSAELPLEPDCPGAG
jgi:hypothetical protein